MKLILAYIQFRLNHPKIEWTVIQSDVSRETGIDKKAVSRYFKSLVAFGVVELTHSEKQHHGGVLKFYSINPTKLTEFISKEVIPSQSPNETALSPTGTGLSLAGTGLSPNVTYKKEETIKKEEEVNNNKEVPSVPSGKVETVSISELKPLSTEWAIELQRISEQKRNDKPTKVYKRVLTRLEMEQLDNEIENIKKLGRNSNWPVQVVNTRIKEVMANFNN